MTAVTAVTAATSRRALRICFVAPNIYPVLSGARDIPVIGGAEFRQSVLARAFVVAGYEVSVVTQDFGQPHGELIDGVRVLNTHTPTEGIPILRYVHPRLTSVVSRLREADADVYYQSSASHLTGVVAWHCRRSEARSIYSGASDTDFMRGQERVAHARDRWLFRWGLAHVDAVVTQTARQADLLSSHYHRDAQVIPNPYAAPVRQRAQRADMILWVGGIRRVKRPDRFIALARRLPQYRFCMIGGAVGNDVEARNYFAAMRAEASGVDNLEFHGFLPLAQVEPYFDEARVFVNTSEHEGFPNTFLQAWARGIPTVSYFDSGAGRDGERPFEWVNDEAAAIQALNSLMSNPDAWQTLSQRCTTHFNETHSTERVVQQYSALFDRLKHRVRGTAA